MLTYKNRQGKKSEFTFIAIQGLTLKPESIDHTEGLSVVRFQAREAAGHAEELEWTA